MDERHFAVAKHEACHVVSAHLLGWPVTGASRSNSWDGVTNLEPRIDGAILDRAEELGIILLCAVILQPAGASDDLRRLSELVQAGASLSSVWDRAHAMVDSHEFRVKRIAVEDALLRRPALTGTELEEILAA